ncbi:MAG TPA: PilN domain-containing protein [Nostocaceae cyanobacterium]|nr:PilN domain-containing protein [Nostocaceae cyanobacterium]
MYSLDINFLKDRPAYQKNNDRSVSKKPAQPGNYIPVYIGLGVGLLFPTLMAAGLWWVDAATKDLEGQITALTNQTKELDKQIANIQGLERKATNIKNETQALVSVFDQIRPWSAMLQDVGDRIPTAVQIETIKQIDSQPPRKNAPNQTVEPPTNPLGELEITGYARTFNDVNDFLLTLQQSKFLNDAQTKIITSELVDVPFTNNQSQQIPEINKPKVVKYTIRAGLSVTPASKLLQDLEKVGAVGLIRRINTIKETGVITK